MEVVLIDLKKCNLLENLARDRLEWRTEFIQLDLNIVGSWDKALMMAMIVFEMLYLMMQDFFSTFFYTSVG